MRVDLDQLETMRGMLTQGRADRLSAARKARNSGGPNAIRLCDIAAQ